MIIDLDGVSIRIVRKRIKHMYLRIQPATGELHVSAPLKLSIETIQNHLASKRVWIHNARMRVLARKPAPLLSMNNGDQHFYLGQAYTLVLHPYADDEKIVLEGDLMHVFIKNQINPVDHNHSYLQQWYKKQMQALLPELIRKWEPIIGVSVRAFGVRSMKTRWGSCNLVTHRINLNLHLIKKPLICLEYVLVHEMVHLLEANHSKRFYALMSQFMPLWREHQKTLESVSRELLNTQ